MTVHALNNQEVRLLREELEMLMVERQKLLQVVGAAAVLVANLDSETLPQDQDTIDAAELLAESLNALSEESLKDALDAVRAEFDAEAQREEPRAN
jgi:tellurite resistance protein